jgi:hypothetical protein
MPGSRFRTALLAAGLFAAALPARAQSPSVEQLERELARRDAVIEDLQRRLEAVERRLGEQRKDPPASPRRADQASVDQLLSRALERSLVRSGGEVLEPGEFEIEPSVQYEYARRSGLAILGSGIGFQDVTQRSLFASVELRAGLPWSSQLELFVPYGRVTVDTVTAGTPTSAKHRGRGDLQVGLSKELVREASRRPGLIGHLTWQEASGEAAGVAFEPSLGQGHDALHAGLTMVKRMEPVVFVASLSHSFNRSAHLGGATIDPGDTNSASLTAILAASPDVSLRSGFSVSRSVSELRIDGTPIAGSKQTVAMVELGGAVSLTRSTLLDFAVGIGITPEAPDFSLGVSLPIRF